jgi:hypothetical protein
MFVAGKVYLAEISEGAYASCPRLGLVEHLRGLRLRIKRIDTRPNGRVVAELFEEGERPMLPAGRSVRDLLQVIWFGRPKDAEDLLPEPEGGKEDESSI